MIEETMTVRNDRISTPWIAAWVTLMLTGILVLESYSSNAGTPGDSTAEWPAECEMARAADAFTLLMFIHPRCPCSRASIRELARIHALTIDRVDIRVVFFQPATEIDDWSNTDLVRSAALIPGVTVVRDTDARLASQFSVNTSGHVLLYGETGQLLFSGGVTAGRGHEGDNAGEDTVVSLIRKHRRLPGSSPVFGCPIMPSN